MIWPGKLWNKIRDEKKIKNMGSLVFNHPSVIARLVHFSDFVTIIVLCRINKFFYKTVRKLMDEWKQKYVWTKDTTVEEYSKIRHIPRDSASLQGVDYTLFKNVEIGNFYIPNESNGLDLGIIPRSCRTIQIFVRPNYNRGSYTRVKNIAMVPDHIYGLAILSKEIYISDIFVNLEQKLFLRTLVIHARQFSGQIFFPRQLRKLSICVEEMMSSGFYIPGLPELVELEVCISWDGDKQDSATFFDLNTFPLLEKLTISNGWNFVAPREKEIVTFHSNRKNSKLIFTFKNKE